MHPDWLAETQALCDQATPGPWYTWRTLHDAVQVGNQATHQICTASDTRFIAEARTRLPEALAEIQRLQALVHKVVMWFDPVGHDQAMQPFGVGDPTAFTNSDEIRCVCGTFDEAVKEWEALCAREPRKGFYITGLGHGVIAHFHDVRDIFAERRGTDECPICDLNTPHEHSGASLHELQAYRCREQAQMEKRRREILSLVASVNRRADRALYPTGERP
jgi:hypothetical protein